MFPNLDVFFRDGATERISLTRPHGVTIDTSHGVLSRRWVKPRPEAAKLSPLLSLKGMSLAGYLRSLCHLGPVCEHGTHESRGENSIFVVSRKRK